MRALLMNESSGPAEVVDEPDSSLPDGDLTIAVEYSSLNYKDAMVLQGQGGLARNFPHVPGIDLAGTVESCDDGSFAPGDPVLVTGWRVGESRWGGYATKARVPSAMANRIPDSLDAFQAMAVGTAGFTAMMAVDTLEGHGVVPGDGQLVVTGASGGLGSMAVRLASRAGFEVVASTGRTEEADYLRELGAAEVIDRGEIQDAPERPLLSERWAGGIDAVGGDTLAHVLAETRYGGVVAACGLAQSPSLATTVIPFLLRGVSLLGVDSVMCPSERRDELWARVGEVLDRDTIGHMAQTVGLADLVDLAPRMLAGQIRGRVVVDVAA